jgi:ribonuclease J
MNAAAARDRLIYMPLGGSGEVGMNCYVYGYGPPGRERLIVVDLGVTFPDMDGTPGVELILPDIRWLEERRDRIEAIFITHAHEDHVGAVGWLWHRLKAKMYARPFTAYLARLKMEEHDHDVQEVVTTGKWPERVEAGPFTVGFLPVSHSIPETSALVIDTPAGRVVHTADFKIDPTPVVGEPFDEALWAEVAAPGVRALVCDSTNVAVAHPGRSEASIVDNIHGLVAGAKGMVVATTFASNIARLKTLAEAGQAAGRSIVLMGRAMRKMVSAAVETGVLTDFPRTLAPEEAADIPREHLMLLVTGSQGERRAASAALSRGKYLGIELKEGDLFLFSSRTIPGNERGVIRIVNNLSEIGVDVVDDSGGLYHVSGHANRPDLERVHALMKPQFLIPNHGEHRMLRAHVKLGAENGIPGMVVTNGTMVDLSGNRLTVCDHVEAGRTYIDGDVAIGAMDGVVRDRIRMALNGLVVVTMIVDEDDTALGDAWVECMGLPETGHSRVALVEVLETEINRFLGRAAKKTLRDDEKLEKEIVNIAKRAAQDEIGKKPEVIVVVSRLAA